MRLFKELNQVPEMVVYCEGIQMIVDEHPALRRQMEEIKDQVYWLDFVSPVTQERALMELHAFIQTFKAQVRAHSAAEEGEFSPLLGRHFGMDAMPIVANEQQHAEAKKNIVAFEQHFAAWRDGAHEQVLVMKESLLTAVQVLSDHFDREETVLFPMAEHIFTPAEKAELLNRLQVRV